MNALVALKQGKVQQAISIVLKPFIEINVKFS